MENYRYVLTFVFFGNLYFYIRRFLDLCANRVLVVPLFIAQSAFRLPIGLYGCALDRVGHINSHFSVKNEVEYVFLDEI